MWSNAGLSTSILITTLSPANGMVHHTVARIFVSTKLRDLGPKSSTARTFWKMIAICIRYEPPTIHLLWDLTTFSLAGVKAPYVGTSFLGLAYPFLPLADNGSDDTPEFPQNPPICFGQRFPTINAEDAFRLAMVIPLPPVGLLETVLLSLREGEILSESTVRRLRRKEAEMRAAAAEGRTPLSEYRRRKLKKIATASTSRAAGGLSSERETPVIGESNVASATRAHTPKMRQKTTVQLMATVNPFDIERRKFSVEDVERLAASASLRRRSDSQSTMPPNHT